MCILNVVIMIKETKPYTFDEFNRKMEEMQALNDEYVKIMSKGFQGVIR